MIDFNIVEDDDITQHIYRHDGYSYIFTSFKNTSNWADDNIWADDNGMLTRNKPGDWKIYIKHLGWRRWHNSNDSLNDECYQLTLEEASAIITLDEV